jgi:hypothetical protein
MRRGSRLVRALQAGLAYFAIVFGAGFALAPVRILWLVPRVGQRWAELIELPVMLLVIVLAARWIVRRFDVAPSAASRLAMGMTAGALLLLVEFTVVLWLQGMTFGDYLAQRDPVSGAAYYLSVAFFTLLPLLLTRARRAV